MNANDIIANLRKRGKIDDESLETAHLECIKEELTKKEVRIPKITKREKGNIVQFYVTVPKKYSKTGARHQIVSYSEANVKKLFMQEAYSVITNTLEQEELENATVQDIVKRYLDHISPTATAAGTVKPSTASNYRRIFENYIKNTEFGSHLFVNINKMLCEDFLKTLYNRQVSATYAREIKCVVKQSFAYVGKNGYEQAAIMHELTINSGLCSKKRAHKNDVWSDAELVKIWEGSIMLWEHGHKCPYSAIILILAFTGCRIGELCAATWDDVDFENGTLRINKTTIDYTDYDNHKKCHIISDSPKTPSSNRTVDLTYGALIWLSALKRRNEELHIPGNHIVCTKSGRIPSQNEISDRLRYFCKVIGVEYKASHSCRRYYATSMLESGIALPQVSNDLGHADAATTHKFYNKIKEKDTSKIMKQKNKVQRRQFGNLATPGNTPE